MTPYRNLSGLSGVVAVELEEDRIHVQFETGKVLTYTYASAGRQNVEQMKVLAVCGRGLNTYINRTPAVKYGYLG